MDALNEVRGRIKGERTGIGCLLCSTHPPLSSTDPVFVRDYGMDLVLVLLLLLVLPHVRTSFAIG